MKTDRIDEGSAADADSRIGVNAGLELPHAPTVLLLVDVINPMDFDGADALAPSALAAADALGALKAVLRARGVPALYVNDNFGQWQSDFAGLLRRCRARRGAAATLVRRLAPEAGDITVLKPRHSGFHATPLELLLQEMRTRALVIAGLAADQCVQITAADAYQRGFRLWVPADCTAAETPERHRSAMEWMALHLKASVDAVGPKTSLLKWLTYPRPRPRPVAPPK